MSQQQQQQPMFHDPIMMNVEEGKQDKQEKQDEKKKQENVLLASASDDQIINQIQGRTARARTIRRPNEICVNYHEQVFSKPFVYTDPHYDEQPLSKPYVYTDPYTGHRYCFSKLPNEFFDTHDDQYWRYTNPFTGRVINKSNIEQYDGRRLKVVQIDQNDDSMTRAFRDLMQTKCMNDPAQVDQTLQNMGHTTVRWVDQWVNNVYVSDHPYYVIPQTVQTDLSFFRPCLLPGQTLTVYRGITFGLYELPYMNQFFDQLAFDGSTIEMVYDKPFSTSRSLQVAQNFAEGRMFGVVLAFEAKLVDNLVDFTLVPNQSVLQTIPG